MGNTQARSRQDPEQLIEVELCTTLLIAASGSDDALTQDEVDQLLGIRPRSLA